MNQTTIEHLMYTGIDDNGNIMKGEKILESLLK